MKSSIKLISTFLIFSAVLSLEYCFNIVGLRSYFGYSTIPWIIMVTIGSVSVWVYDMYSLKITGWLLGRTDELYNNSSNMR